MASVTVQETAWNNGTTPKTATHAGAAAGDILLVMIHGNKSNNTTNAMISCTTSTTAGSTSAWTELIEDFTAGTSSATWMSSAWATVSSTGSVTVSVAVSQTTSVNSFGFVCYLLNGYSSIGNTGSAINGTVEAINLTVTEGSFVGYLAGEWDINALGTTYTPSGQTVVEATNHTVYSVQGAYWENQGAGTRDYGTTDSAGTSISLTAIEVLVSAGPSTTQTFVRPVQSPLQLIR